MNAVIFYTDITRCGRMSATNEIVKEMVLVSFIVMLEI